MSDAICPRCLEPAVPVYDGAVRCNEHGLQVRRLCCTSLMGDEHAEGCRAPVAVERARRRFELDGFERRREGQ